MSTSMRYTLIILFGFSLAACATASPYTRCGEVSPSNYSLCVELAKKADEEKRKRRAASNKELNKTLNNYWETKRILNQQNRSLTCRSINTNGDLRCK